MLPFNQLKGGDFNYKDLVDEFLSSEDSEPVTEELTTREILETLIHENPLIVTSVVVIICI